MEKARFMLMSCPKRANIETYIISKLEEVEDFSRVIVDYKVYSFSLQPGTVLVGVGVADRDFCSEIMKIFSNRGLKLKILDLEVTAFLRQMILSYPEIKKEGVCILWHRDNFIRFLIAFAGYPMDFKTLRIENQKEIMFYARIFCNEFETKTGLGIERIFASLDFPETPSGIERINPLKFLGVSEGNLGVAFGLSVIPGGFFDLF